MKNVKIFGFALLSFLFSIFVSCSNIDSTNNSPVYDGYGTITVNGSSSDRFLDEGLINSIEKAVVTVSAYGEKDIVIKDVAIKSGKSEPLTIKNIPAGKNRVITVKAQKTVDSILTNMEGVVISAVFDVQAGKTTDVSVNKNTTALGNVFKALLSKKYSKTGELSQNTVKGYLPSVPAGLIDADKLADDIIANKTISKDNYVVEGGSVTFYSDSASSDVSVWVNDSCSEKLTSVKAGMNEIEGVAPGKWTMYFIFKNSAVIGEVEVDLTTDSVVVIDDVFVLKSTKPRLEDENGNAITENELPLSGASKVYLKARAYEDEKVSPDVVIKYTTDGSDPLTSGTVKTYSETNGIEISKNTVIKAYSSLAPLYDSEVAEIPVTVRCSAPVLVDAKGKVIEDPNFKEVTTVYLKADEGAKIRYFENDASVPVVYDSTKGITLKEKTTIKAVASLEGYEDSIEYSFGVNVTLPIGTLTISGTTASTRRFPEENIISITSDSKIEGITIIYTTDGTVPSVDADLKVTNGGVYTESFRISKDTTITAMAFKEGWQNSEVAGPVKFVRQTQLNTPSITGKTSFVSETPVTISYTPSAEGEVPAIYYLLDKKDATADEIIKDGTLYTEPFTVSKSTYVRTVAVLEDYVTSLPAELQFTMSENLELVTFTASNSTIADYTIYTPFIRIWTNGKDNSTWAKGEVDASGAITFEMPVDQTTFLVTLCQKDTVNPDWEAIKDMVGRVYYQTNMNGISYFKGIRTYTAEFTNYTPDERVKEIDVAFNKTTKKVTLSTQTTGAYIYYTLDGTDPVDSNGSAKSSAKRYSAPFTIDNSTSDVTIKAAAVKEGYITSAIRTYSTGSALDLTFYVGVPAKIVLPDEDDETQERTLTTQNLTIAVDGNGYYWKEIPMEKCASSTTSVYWYKATIKVNKKAASGSESLLTFQPRISVTGQTKDTLYMHPWQYDTDGKTKVCKANLNMNANINNYYCVIDATNGPTLSGSDINPGKWAWYTSMETDTSSGKTKKYTCDFCVTEDSLITFTNTDPAK